MHNKLDINMLNNGFKNVKIGELSQEVIDILKLNRITCDIILWEDRLKYIEKHKINFKSEEDYKKHISLIPEIIKNPDYVGKHSTKNSIEYIKRIDELMIIAIRIKNKGNLALRSAYPLSKKQLQDYLDSGTIKKLDE